MGDRRESIEQIARDSVAFFAGMYNRDRAEI